MQRCIYLHLRPHVLVQLRRTRHMLHGHDLHVAGQQTLEPRQRQIDGAAHGDQQLLVHFRRAEAAVARVQLLGLLLVLANGARALAVGGAGVRGAALHALGKQVLEVVVGVAMAAGNVDELGVLLAATGELFVLELRK